MKNAIIAAGFTLSFALYAAPHPEMLVSTDWLAQHLSDPKLVILHVSANRNAYDAGHIPGARFVPLSDLVVTRNGVLNELPETTALQKVLEGAGVADDTRVILYGDTSVLPATRAYFTLDYLGHGEHTSLLDGGLGKWNAEGRVVTKDAPASTAGHLSPHPKPGTLVQFDQVSDLAKRAPAASLSPILLDVRPAADFSGEKGSHIPTSINASWIDSQLSAQNQTLKPEADLRKMYDALGVKADVPVITYCNSGMQASQSYFTLKYLGYDVKLYDGSMSEWTLKGAPVAK
jgi:thiosulfate/3-mercaptopyruvate sulfurtransferase